MEWNKYPDTKPNEEGDYLTCDQYGKITIKSYGRVWREKAGGELLQKKVMGFTGRNSSTLANNVFYWAEIPLPPTINNEAVVKLEALKREKERILAEMNELEKQLKGE